MIDRKQCVRCGGFVRTSGAELDPPHVCLPVIRDLCARAEELAPGPRLLAAVANLAVETRRLCDEVEMLRKQIGGKR
jgi:hypothetical protein